MMLVLGGYPFSIDTASPRELVHERQWEWVENEVISRSPDLQYTGPKPDRITLKGVIYPEYYGGTLQMDILSLMGNRGMPMLLVNGIGMVLGFWVIEHIDENQTYFTSTGQPRKIEFGITLKRFADFFQAIQMLSNNPLSAVGL